MTSSETLKWLAANGTAQNRKIYSRHGAREPMFGVSYANLEKLRKQIKLDQPLAEALWESGNHDARVLACKIADPARCSASLLDRWLKEIDHVLAHSLADLASRTPAGPTLAEKWSSYSKEWPATVGWTLVGILADRENQIANDFWKDCLARIGREIHASPNWVRYAMNNALIGIGVGRPNLTKEALAVAKRIGPVKVDHGETGCKTPDAHGYILKTLDYRQKKAGAGRRR